MPTETQLEQRVAALQSDLNARDQALDDAATENNERELSRRDWFEEAQRLQADLTSANADKEAYAQNAIDLRAKLAERDALLRECFIAMLKGGHSKPLRERIKTALSASVEPEPSKCAACQGNGFTGEEPVECGACDGRGYSAPVEGDERADFEAYCTVVGLPVDRIPSGEYLIPATRFGYQGWQARAALERKP